MLGMVNERQFLTHIVQDVQMVKKHRAKAQGITARRDMASLVAVAITPWAVILTLCRRA